MKSVAIVTNYGWLGISSPLINTILLLLKKDYNIDLYLKQDTFCDNLKISNTFIKHKNLNSIYYNQNINSTNLLKKHILEIKNMKKKIYKFIIAFDIEGLIKAGILFRKMQNLKLVYFSLEIYDIKDKLKDLEIYFNKYATVTITQDKYRIRILSILNKIDKKSCSHVWNSSYEETLIKNKNTYLRKKFNIPKSKKIILATGTLLETTGIDELIESNLFQDERYVVILHGWIPNDKFRKYILSKVDDKNIFLSEDIIPFSEKYKIFSSADFGYISYNPLDLNLKYAAGSSGKLFDFMRCGVPVIGNNIPFMKKYIENNNVGKVFNKKENILNSINIIDTNYSYFVENCFKTFKNYSFKKSFQNALKDIL
ncbi:MAG: hypothetical protein C0626_12780 [Arcobacter sp.]|uniref:hypothetical protein n=1 Tax=uncultured Arcobacter sp. TaxID=165434 RepID=UPI000CC79517|nr:hypothetical protein [uncultured Arcobacter sp.]PLY08717.1 MAG: hypothetical protein C0626_12780 [Arcobacter sp.]